MGEPKIDGAFLRREVRKVTGMKDGEEDFDLALVMLSSGVVGTSVTQLAAFTGLPNVKVRKFAAQLRATGIWRNRRVYDSGWFEKDGGIAFNLDIGVAKGWFKRQPGAAPALQGGGGPDDTREGEGAG